VLSVALSKIIGTGYLGLETVPESPKPSTSMVGTKRKPLQSNLDDLTKKIKVEEATNINVSVRDHKKNSMLDIKDHSNTFFQMSDFGPDEDEIHQNDFQLEDIDDYDGNNEIDEGDDNKDDDYNPFAEVCHHPTVKRRP
jgi:hypothetical protein